MSINDRAFAAFLPVRCKTYPDFVECCPHSACRIQLAYQVMAWKMQGSLNNARVFGEVLAEGNYNPNTKHRPQPNVDQD